VTLKLLAVSDVALPQLQDSTYLCRTFEDIGLLVSCGDMPASYLDYISSVLNVSLYFVRGNHDENYVERQPGGDDLHRRILRFGRFSFLGLEGSIRYNRGRVQYTDSEMFSMVLRLMPRLLVLRSVRGYSVDVVVAHSPPRGIHDLPGDRAHRGFSAFRTLIEWGRPRYLLHGHVDTWDNRQTVETVHFGTRVININPSRVVALEEPPGGAG
jgi:Icc-related predicted phosphoesterase